MRRSLVSVYLDPVDREVLRRLCSDSRVPMAEYLRVWIKAGLYGEETSGTWIDRDLQRERRTLRDELLDRRQSGDVEADGSDPECSGQGPDGEA